MPEKSEDQEVRVRSFWSGTITFGLVSIPVSLFPASRSGGVALHLIDKRDGTPLNRLYFCSKDDKALDWDDIVRGYESEKGNFVIVTDEELESLEPEKTRDIDLKSFVGRDEIDPIFFERGYYLVPSGNSTKAYRLLAATLEESKRAGIATFVMRDKEYLVAILGENGILRAEILRFADEVRTPAEIGLPKPQKAKPAAVKKFVTQIGKHEKPKLSMTELEDEETDRLMALIKRKEKRNEGVFEAPAELIEEARSETTVLDLMQLLKRSMKTSGAKSTPKRSSTRKTSSTRTRSSRARKSA